MAKYLEMNNITKIYPGVRALSDVSIAVDEGEIVALLGENGAGKSTLMNVLGGVVSPDAGQIMIDGKETSIKSVSDALQAGIAFIHQELSLFKQLTIEENIFIERFPGKKNSVLIDKKKMRQETEKILKELDVDLPANTKISKLPMSYQQIVEIAAAVYKNAKIIILDEPTTSIAAKEREKLFEIMMKMKAEGRVIIYITHELDEALKFSDTVYVLRDGQNAGTAPSDELGRNDVIKMMIGSKAGKQFAKSEKELTDEVVLEVRDIYTRDKLRGASLQLKKGEVLGLYGLVGAGRSELARALYGVDKIESGEVLLWGEEIKKPTPKMMKRKGLAFLTENRRDEGLFLELGINQNISITNLDKISHGSFKVISNKKDQVVAEDMTKALKISTPSIYQFAGRLSGGNQQKVVIAKWLLIEPGIFIMDEPTRGIDVGAKDEIYSLIDELARKGMSILLISSEIEEILGMSDRVIVMAKGKTVAELCGEEVCKEEIVKYTMS